MIDIAYNADLIKGDYAETAFTNRDDLI